MIQLFCVSFVSIYTSKGHVGSKGLLFGPMLWNHHHWSICLVTLLTFDKCPVIVCVHLCTTCSPSYHLIHVFEQSYIFLFITCDIQMYMYSDKIIKSDGISKTVILLYGLVFIKHLFFLKSRFFFINLCFFKSRSFSKSMLP